MSHQSLVTINLLVTPHNNTTRYRAILISNMHTSWRGKNQQYLRDCQSKLHRISFPRRQLSTCGSQRTPQDTPSKLLKVFLIHHPSSASLLLPSESRRYFIPNRSAVTRNWCWTSWQHSAARQNRKSKSSTAFTIWQESVSDSRGWWRAFIFKLLIFFIAFILFRLQSHFVIANAFRCFSRLWIASPQLVSIVIQVEKPLLPLLGAGSRRHRTHVHNINLQAAEQSYRIHQSR